MARITKGTSARRRSVNEFARLTQAGMSVGRGNGLEVLHFAGAGGWSATVNFRSHLELPRVCLDDPIAEAPGGLMAQHGDGAAAEAAAGHARTWNTFDAQRGIHQEIEFGAA